MKQNKDGSISMGIDDTRKADTDYVFLTVDVGDIVAHGNIRETGDTDDLAASIRSHGIINPITVVQDIQNPGKYRVVAGFRRFAAARKAGLGEIPCHVISSSGMGLEEVALTENISRLEMTPYEECKAVQHLVNKKNTAKQVARKFGRTVRWVLVRKKLADAGEKVLEKVAAGMISMQAAAKLAHLSDESFREAMESCYSFTESDVARTLERYNKDLNRAPFDRDTCLTCPMCSTAQADLFGERDAYCLNPECWAGKCREAAERKAAEYIAKGVKAKVGDLSYGSDDYGHQLHPYQTEEIEEAQKAGIAKRVIIDPDTCDETEFYDERDLPGYHEVTEEEKEAINEKRRQESRFRDARTDIYKDRLSGRIADVVEAEGNGPAIVTILALCDSKDWLDDAAKERFRLDENMWSLYPEDIPEGTWDTDIAELARTHVREILDSFGKESLEALYRMIIDDNSRKDLTRFMPTDEEIREEIARQDEMEAAESEHDEEKEGDDE